MSHDGETIPFSPDPDETSPRREPMPEDVQETFILTKNQMRRLLNMPPPGEATLNENVKFVVLLVRGMAERIPLTQEFSVIVGRADLKMNYHPDIDLTPYGAQTRGVSRMHVRLFRHEDNLYVVDLGSANGTVLSGNKLKPEEPHLLHEGDELLLGSLAVRITFE
jgi:hypothetical protein